MGDNEPAVPVSSLLNGSYLLRIYNEQDALIAQQLFVKLGAGGT